MSIATQIARLQGLRNSLRAKILALGLDTDPALDLEDCVGIIEDISGTQDITDTKTVDVAGKQYARVIDENLIPQNIVKGQTILGVSGTGIGGGSASIQKTKTWLYGGSAAPSTILPDRGYDAIAQVVPERTDANPALVPANIKNGATIMGVTGNYETPTETKSPTLTDLKNAGITSHSVNVTPSSGKHLSQVTIPQITSAIDSNIIASNIRNGVSILGVTGNAVVTYAPLSITANNSADEVRRQLIFPLSSDIQNVSQIVYLKAVAHTATGPVPFGSSSTFNSIIAEIEYHGNLFTSSGMNGIVSGLVVYDDSGIADTTSFRYVTMDGISYNPLCTLSIIEVSGNRYLSMQLNSTSYCVFGGVCDTGTVMYGGWLLYTDL